MRLTALAALAVAGMTAPPGQPARAEARPDVLLIVLDDVNDWAGHLGGHPGARTPRLDAFARRNVYFTNAHCSAPLCKPSRAQMLSGLRGVESWRDVEDPSLWITQTFAGAGYRVVGAGKVFHAKVTHWFEDYFRPGPAPEPEGRERNLLGEEHRGTLDWRSLDVDVAEMPDHRLATWVVERLREEDERPLFLAVGIDQPHLPWYLPAAYFKAFPLEDVVLPRVREGDLSDVPEKGRVLALDIQVHDHLVQRDLWGRAVRAYLAALALADEQLGRILEGLEASHRRDRTIVVIVSDHGWHLGEKRHWRKQTLWEDGTRIPLIVAPPGGAARPGSRAQPVDALSIYPTLCELAGLSVPAHVQGHSLVPLVEDPDASWEHAALTTLRRHSALRTERYRYIRYGDGGEELYDHSTDPHEWENRVGSADAAAVLEELRARMDAALEEAAR